MDNHKELIERLKIDAEWAEGQEWETPLCLWDDLMDAVSALAALTEENAQLRAKLKSAQESHAFWMEEEMSVQKQLRAELEQVTAQRDAYKGTLDSANQTNAAMVAKLEQVKRERDGIKVAFEDIASKPDCNICCDRTCMYRPMVGETTRFNCPLWRGPQKEECAWNG